MSNRLIFNQNCHVVLVNNWIPMPKTSTCDAHLFFDSLPCKFGYVNQTHQTCKADIPYDESLEPGQPASGHIALRIE